MLEEERLKRKQFEMLQAEKEAQFRGKLFSLLNGFVLITLLVFLSNLICKSKTSTIPIMWQFITIMQTNIIYQNSIPQFLRIQKNICYYYKQTATNFAEAQRRLKELEDEKQKLDAELKAAQAKISKTELTAQALQVQFRVSSDNYGDLQLTIIFVY